VLNGVGDQFGDEQRGRGIDAAVPRMRPRADSVPSDHCEEGQGRGFFSVLGSPRSCDPVGSKPRRPDLSEAEPQPNTRKHAFALETATNSCARDSHMCAQRCQLTGCNRLTETLDPRGFMGGGESWGPMSASTA
jgi:hypothetical protein